MTANETRVEALIDNAAAIIWMEASKAEDRLDRVRSSLYSLAGFHRVDYRGEPVRYSHEPGRYLETVAQAIDAVTEITSGVREPPRGRTLFDYGKYGSSLTTIKEYEELNDQVVDLRAKSADFDRAYKDWSRFFLVQNTNGHIHSSMRCSTCFPTTRFSWLPDLSGLDEEEAVKAHGAILCTVCFPSAPLHWTDQYEREKEAKKAARCPGSGKAPASMGRHYRYGTCAECGSTQTITPRGVVRAHKRPKEKGAA